MKEKVHKIVIGSDHNGFIFKEELKKYLTVRGYYVEDFGQFDISPPAKDYNVAEEAALAVSNNKFDRGILICGTGDGVCIVANKIAGCRASLCYNTFSAEVSRAKNNSNIAAFGGKTMKLEEIKNMLDIWLVTDFDNGQNDQRNIARNQDLIRIDKKHRK